MNRVRKIFAILIVLVSAAYAAEQTLKIDTFTHQVIAPPASAGATYDIQFGPLTTDIVGGGGGAPTNATYVTTSANGTLTNEFSLGALADGLLKITVVAGVATPSIATPGTDYLTSNQTITLSGNVTGSGTTAITTTIADDAVTFAKFQNINTDSILGRATAASGDVEQLTALPWALTGDVTTVADANATTIANNAVTYAKMQDISATSRFLGRITAGAGDTEELTAANAKTILALTSGDVGLGNVTNDAQTKAAIVPNTAPSAGQLLLGNAGGTAYAPQTMGTDATITSAGALTIANNAVSLAKMADIATDSIIGRATAAAGDPEVLTALPFAFTGDVTRPADSNAQTIANDAVTFAKMQNATANSKLVGSGSAGSGADYTEITLGSGLSMTGTTLSVSAGGGNVSSVGTPTDDQIAVWTTASTIEGITPTSPILSSVGAISLDVGVDFNFTGSQTITVNNADTGVYSVFSIGHNTTGAPANDMGSAMLFRSESSSTVDQLQGALATAWSNVTDGSRSAYMDFLLVNNAAALASKMRLFPSGGLSVNSTTDPGAGYINAATGFKINNVELTWTDIGIPSGSTSGDLLLWDGAGWNPTPMGGDATIAGNGNLTIADDKITYAKMQNVSAASKLLGRGSAAGAGNVEEITLGTNLSMSGSTLNATGGSGSPGGSDTQVQFNDSSAFGGDAGFTYDKTTDLLTVGGRILAGSGSGSSPSFSFPGTSDGIYSLSGTNLVIAAGGEAILVQPAAIRTKSSTYIGWSSDTNPFNAPDLSIARNAAGILEINNGTAGQWGSLIAGKRDAGTNDIQNGLTLSRLTTGTPANDLGIGLQFQLQSSTTNNVNAGQIATRWNDVTHASYAARMDFLLPTGGAAPTTVMSLSPTGTLDVDTGFTIAGTNILSDVAFASSWNGLAATAPSKNAVYDWGHTFDTDDDGKVNVLDQAAGITNTDASGVIQTPKTAPSGAIVGDTDTQTLTNKTVGAGALTLAENASVALDEALTDGNYTGITIPGIAGYTQASTAYGDLVQLDSTSSRWELVDANAAAAAVGDARTMLGIMLTASTTDGNACTILLQGTVRANTKFPTFTVGAPIYASETAGTVTNTQPTTADVVIRIVGYGLANTDTMYFAPSGTWTTHL